jgi:hypothetical protein
MEAEEWKPVSLNTNYAVSNYGRVKRIDSNKILQTHCKSCDYNQIGLMIKGKCKTLKVHWLVTAAFLGPRPEGYETNHKDGNKRNNHISNLEYVTSGENNLHAYRMGLRKPSPRLGEACNKAKLNRNEVLKIRELRRSGYTTVLLAKMFGISHSSISDIMTKKSWKWLEEK